ncbi:hypothetical protein CVIRNUC_007124 [Coccomyxa viridis]|uniref:Uncharacterized protein n=1 Tax=Coccomyxa viridis TaxID=1274662 RepID=A0AAV1I9N5_9CHLO|nr:hypothetical protein CVIRNUC_007124 [Coccomyxa viridis]
MTSPVIEQEPSSRSGSSSNEDDQAELAFDSVTSRRPPPKKQKREQPVPFEALQQAGFEGGPSLADAAERIGIERRQQKEAERAAAEAAKQQEAEQEAEEEAARALKAAKKQQSPADSLQQHLESGTYIVTQNQRRGAVLRAQADAALDLKFAAGQAQNESVYAGAAQKEAAASAARAALGARKR